MCLDCASKPGSSPNPELTSPSVNLHPQRLAAAVLVRERYRAYVKARSKWHNPATGRIAPVPDWGDKDLKVGTLRAIVKQLGLDREDVQQAR